jgi:hypothetical protein
MGNWLIESKATQYSGLGKMPLQQIHHQSMHHFFSSSQGLKSSAEA